MSEEKVSYDEVSDHSRMKITYRKAKKDTIKKYGCENNELLKYPKWVFLEDECSPVLPDVKVIKRWDYWDGCITGICEILEQKFIFTTLLYGDGVRYYDREYSVEWKDDQKFNATHLDSDNSSRVYQVWPLKVEYFNTKYKGKCNNKEMNDWFRQECGEPIGIFWDYKRCF